MSDHEEDAASGNRRPRRRSGTVATGLLLASLAPAIAACGDAETTDVANSSTPPVPAPVEMVDARIVDRLPDDPALRFSSYDACAGAIGADNCDATPALEAQPPGVCAIDDPQGLHGAGGSWTDDQARHHSHAVFVPSYGYHGYYPMFSGGTARVAAPARAGIVAFSGARVGASASSVAVSGSARGGFGGIGVSAVAGG